MRRRAHKLTFTRMLTVVAIFICLSAGILLLAYGNADAEEPRSEAIILPEAPPQQSNSYPNGAFPFQSTPRVVIPIPFAGDRTDDGTVGQFQDWTALQQQRVAIAAAEALSNVQFAFDSSEIEEQFLPLIERVAALLAANHELALSLAGHTDLVGGDAYNDLLGARRAEALKGALVGYGVEESRIRLVSYGESLPLRPILEATRENRRVEIIPFAQY
jgi:outer membrane protein OmpA-like peptidoglycan-associated protein